MSDTPANDKDHAFGVTPEQRRAANRSAVRAGQPPKYPNEPDDPFVKQYNEAQAKN